jgi:hypothetical protein
VILNFLNRADEDEQSVEEGTQEDDALEEVLAQYILAPITQNDEEDQQLSLPAITAQVALQAI